jgi:hypothetical protein
MKYHPKTGKPLPNPSMPQPRQKELFAVLKNARKNSMLDNGLQPPRIVDDGYLNAKRRIKKQAKDLKTFLKNENFTIPARIAKPRPRGNLQCKNGWIRVTLMIRNMLVRYLKESGYNKTIMKWRPE